MGATNENSIFDLRVYRVKRVVKAGFLCLDHLDFLRRMDDGVNPNNFTKTRLYIDQAIVITPVAVSSRLVI